MKVVAMKTVIMMQPKKIKFVIKGQGSNTLNFETKKIRFYFDLQPYFFLDNISRTFWIIESVLEKTRLRIKFIGTVGSRNLLVPLLKKLLGSSLVWKPVFVFLPIFTYFCLELYCWYCCICFVFFVWRHSRVSWVFTPRQTAEPLTLTIWMRC